MEPIENLDDDGEQREPPRGWSSSSSPGRWGLERDRERSGESVEKLVILGFYTKSGLPSPDRVCRVNRVDSYWIRYSCLTRMVRMSGTCLCRARTRHGHNRLERVSVLRRS